MSDQCAGRFVAGFILGAIAGLALGLLYAPQPGKGTRELLKEKIGDVAKRLHLTSEGLTQKFHEGFD